MTTANVQGPWGRLAEVTIGDDVCYMERDPALRIGEESDERWGTVAAIDESTLVVVPHDGTGTVDIPAAECWVD